MHAKPGLMDFIIAMQAVKINKHKICQASITSIPSLSLVVYLLAYLSSIQKVLGLIKNIAINLQIKKNRSV
jgi:hypothetical protein